MAGLARWCRFLLLCCACGLLGAAHARSDAPATIAVGYLPAEAQATLALIRKDGPFPYERDGVVFGNYEGLLPKRARGYYREYTVTTPGVRTRGARRLVAGCAKDPQAAARYTGALVCGRGLEVYYTDDHYRSFKRVID